MPHLVWSRLLFFLTLLGAVFTLASWLGVRGRLILLVLVGLVAVQAAPVFLIHAWNAARHRRRILESIESIGGRITARLAADPTSSWRSICPGPM